MLLSGFMFPIESMPKAMQYFTTILPMRYYLVIVRGIIMKGLGFADLWNEACALGILGVIIFRLAGCDSGKVFG